ncbi:MAG: valine--tRNA ligase [Alphaproteobacteria bacterium GM7ARS4]|nr:valine--tRNA ligase [Alphaproteobacteria bacterium GM7ARS4]
MLAKTYQHQAIEQALYQEEEESGLFAPHQNKESKAFCMMMPPPNVTGSLHMGHALNMTLQDILVRYHRMQGERTLWQPGTDHAGIATQALVERQLASRHQDPSSLTRDELLAHIWAWKERSGGKITAQLRRLGASPDWQRERFTLDDGLSHAVLHAFTTLHAQGLIYRGKRLVNWDPVLETAISDLEVETKDRQGHLWYIRYPLAHKPSHAIIIATTRPETMAGDTAIAVHPDDPRYQQWIGCQCILPLFHRTIPIIADPHADPEKGSGAVKITPAHDMNDFDVGQRHNLPLINVFDSRAHYNDNVPKPWRGMERFQARKALIEALTQQGHIDHIETTSIPTPHGDRSHAIIEPWLTDQWFVDAPRLAPKAIRAVESGDMTFTPATWRKTYLQWLDNIQPWCISRQIRWGHRIPAWHAPDGTIFVANTQAHAEQQARTHYKTAIIPPLTQEEDVLDTWFSSSLWPFSTLGWPSATAELKTFYPNNVLVTGFDILFFWVARMAMMGLHFTGDVPFRHVYVHALVRDEQGQKMSKSKGNVIDPLATIDSYGADALRFTMAASAIPGRDVRLSTSRIQGYRNFTTKIWNAARFCTLHAITCTPDTSPQYRHPLNQWIIHKLHHMLHAVGDELDNGRFDQAAQALYHFIWSDLCDNYIEGVKSLLTHEDEPTHHETRNVMGYVFCHMLHALYPFMPFVSEHIWRVLKAKDAPALIKRTTPTKTLRQKPHRDTPNNTYDNAHDNTHAIDFIFTLTHHVRSLMQDLQQSPKEPISLHIIQASDNHRTALTTHHKLLSHLCPIETITDIANKETHPRHAIEFFVDGSLFAIGLSHHVDMDALQARLSKSMHSHKEKALALRTRLDHEGFVKNAPAAILQEKTEQWQKHHDAYRHFERIIHRLKRS